MASPLVLLLLLDLLSNFIFFRLGEKASLVENLPRFLLGVADDPDTALVSTTGRVRPVPDSSSSLSFSSNTST